MVVFIIKTSTWGCACKCSSEAFCETRRGKQESWSSSMLEVEVVGVHECRQGTRESGHVPEVIPQTAGNHSVQYLQKLWKISNLEWVLMTLLQNVVAENMFPLKRNLEHCSTVTSVFGWHWFWPWLVFLGFQMSASVLLSAFPRDAVWASSKILQMLLKSQEQMIFPSPIIFLTE